MATVIGTNGRDTIDNAFGTTAGDDTISALGGNDTIIGSGGADAIDGGNGRDTLRYTSASQVAGDTYTSIEVFELTGGDDYTFTATAGNDTVISREGNDTIDGGAGDDTLRGNDGNDTLIGGTGADRMFGGSGDDRFVIGLTDATGDEIDGNEGNDTLVVNGSGDLTLTSTTTEFAGQAFILNRVEGLELNGTGVTTVTLDGTTENLLGGITVAAGVFDQVVITGASAYNVDNIISAAQAGVELIDSTQVDGTRIVATTSGTELTVSRFNIASDAYDQITETYDIASGLITRRELDYTDSRGDLLATAEFGSDGIIDTRTVEDRSGNRNFDTQVTTYDATGVRAETVTTYDAGAYDGNVQTDTFTGGKLSLRVMEDTDNDDTYVRITTTYDTSTGKIDVKTTERDDGTLVIEGGSGFNTLTSGTGTNDVLAGGAGYDTFVFGLNSGDDIVRDYDTGNEALDLTAYGIDTVAALAGVTQEGNSTVIDIDGTNSITLLNVDARSIGDGDFVGL